MDSFQNNQKIIVTDAEHPCHGKTGTVVRLRRADDAAWVRMDEDLPMDLRSFPADDERRNHIMLWPEDCEVHHQESVEVVNP